MICSAKSIAEKKILRRLSKLRGGYGRTIKRQALFTSRATGQSDDWYLILLGEICYFPVVLKPHQSDDWPVTLKKGQS